MLVGQFLAIFWVYPQLLDVPSTFGTEEVELILKVCISLVCFVQEFSVVCCHDLARWCNVFKLDATLQRHSVL
jgi:hypothetical protein